eukprot:scaffold269_cov123-Isochrysis_galbana.AAC.19
MSMENLKMVRFRDEWALGVFVLGGGAGATGVVKVKAVLAVTAIFSLFREGAEEAIGNVSATVVKIGNPAAARATMANMFVFAFPPVGGVRVSVVSSQFAEVYYGARGGDFGFGGGREEAFGGA